MSTQIAVKLPDRVVEDLDRLVAAGAFENRSDAVRHAIAVLLAADRRRLIDEAFAEGFRRVPDTGAEVAEARRLAVVERHLG
ncbi:MAG: ribbon-helix-helix domain-containing protein [Acidimicrobiia bacterium]